MENTRKTCLFLRAVEVWPTFDIQINITLAVFWEKLQNYTFRKPTEVSQNTPTFIPMGDSHYEVTALKKMKNLCCFGSSFFKIKIAEILNFSWIKYLGKGLSFLRNGGIWVNYCQNYRLLKLLLYFIEYCLDQLNNKHMKTAVNLTIQFLKAAVKRNIR